MFRMCRIALWLGLVLSGALQAHGKEDGQVPVSELVLSCYRQIVLQQPPLPADELEGFLRQLDQEGAWPDLNYADKHPSAWQPKEHLYRVRWIAHALAAEDTSSERHSHLSNAFNRSLDHWLAKRYKCPNWWWNEIGTPQVMRDIAVLLRNQLDEDHRSGLIEVISQSRVQGTGANLLWQAELAFHRAALSGDEPAMSEAANHIWKEIKVGSNEGIQKDWSFYQHGPRPHAFGYGRSFLDIAVNLAWQSRDTSWAIPAEQRTIVSNFLLEGLQWMSRGTYAPAGTFDRVISRKHSKDAAVLMPVLRRWLEVEHARRDEIARFLRHQEGEADRPYGFRHFPNADFTVYHRPDGSIFLKTVSSRTTLTESIIGENLKGKFFLSSGDHYIVRDGHEYTDLQPILEWEHLPGLTTPPGVSDQERTQFVGGLGNGTSGMTAMNYVRTIDGKIVVQLRKTWFFHGNVMLCLISNAAQDVSDATLVTSLEQCRLRDDVQVFGNEARSLPLLEGIHQLQKGQGILHENVAYMLLDDSPLEVYLGEARGSWSSISSRYDDAPESVTDKVLRLRLPHTAKKIPTGFAIRLGTNEKKAAALATDPPWQILQNDRRCQAICLNDSIAFASFYEPGSIERDKSPMLGKSLQVDQPCLALWTGKKLWMCDPTNKGIKMKVVWGGKSISVDLPAGGISQEIK
jgi:chondroitin AC lyase